MRVLKGRVRAFRRQQLVIVKWQRKMAALFSSEWARDYMTAPAPNLFIERMVSRYIGPNPEAFRAALMAAYLKAVGRG